MPGKRCVRLGVVSRCQLGSCQISMIPAKTSGLKLSSWVFDASIAKDCAGMLASRLQALAPAPRGSLKIKSKDASATSVAAGLAKSVVGNLPMHHLPSTVSHAYSLKTKSATVPLTVTRAPTRTAREVTGVSPDRCCVGNSKSNLSDCMAVKSRRHTPFPRFSIQGGVWH